MASPQPPTPTGDPPRETIVTLTVRSDRPLTADEMLRRAEVWAVKMVHDRFPDRGLYIQLLFFRMPEEDAGCRADVTFRVTYD
ncbi:MAG: hypothetical protein K6V36_14035 [Anaerolineae bacterium]|nr:hypothetical protein [Anaerolineae bacterium]